MRSTSELRVLLLLLPASSKFSFSGLNLHHILLKQKEHSRIHAKVRLHHLERYFRFQPQLFAHRLQQVNPHLVGELLPLRWRRGRTLIILIYSIDQKIVPLQRICLLLQDVLNSILDIVRGQLWAHELVFFKSSLQLLYDFL